MKSSNVKLISAFLVIVVTLFISVCNIVKLFELEKTEHLLEPVKSLAPKEATKYIEGFINENFYGKTSFVNAYGELQKWMGKNEFDNFDVIRDQQGKLHYQYYATKPNDVSVILDEMTSYREALGASDTDLLFVLAPDKYVKGYTVFDKGLPYNYANETADVFLDELQKANIETLDLREGLLESGIAPHDLFFDTDHHWTPQAAFWGFTKLSQKLEEMYEVSLDPEGVFTDISQYEHSVYKDFFLGSQGRRTGRLYSGVEDFTLIKPIFETSLIYTWKDSDGYLTLEGTFEEALLDYGWSLDRNVKLEDRDRYSAYLGGNKVEAIINNRLNPDGLKVLMIKDSFMLPTAAFLSSVVGEIRMIDLRYYEEMNMYEYAKTYEPDVVIIGVNPSSLAPNFFNFKLK